MKRGMQKTLALVLTCWFFTPYLTEGQTPSSPPIRKITEYASTGKQAERLVAYRLFNEKGQVIEEATFDEAGKRIQRITYTYDDRSNKIQETEYGPDDKIVEVRRYQYDAFGNRILRTEHDGAGRLKSSKRFVYEYFEQD